MLARYSAFSSGGQRRQLGLDRGADDHVARTLAARQRRHLLGERVAGGSRGLVDVADVEDGLRGQQVELAQQPAVLVAEVQRARLPARFEERQDPVEQLQARLGLLVLATRALDQPVLLPLQALEIGQQQLGLDQLGVAQADRRRPRHG